MLERALRESPLAHRRPVARPVFGGAGAQVGILEQAFFTHLNLRGDPSDESFCRAVEGAIGVKLPAIANTATQGKDIAVLWLGPNEWLVLGTPAMSDLGVRLSAALAGSFFALNDLSGGQTLVCVSGVNAIDVLSQGCTLDLHPRRFGPGQCAQTLLAKATVVLRPLARNVPTFDVVVRRSFADYLWKWLLDAAAEHGYTAASTAT